MMAGMRDKVIREYFGIALEVVWKTVKEEIPALKSTIKKILAELKWGQKKYLRSVNIRSIILYI